MKGTRVCASIGDASHTRTGRKFGRLALEISTTTAYRFFLLRINVSLVLCYVFLEEPSKEHQVLAWVREQNDIQHVKSPRHAAVLLVPPHCLFTVRRREYKLIAYHGRELPPLSHDP
jgi:hypothetical protein